MKKFLATIELPGGVTLPAKSMPELLDIEKILKTKIAFTRWYAHVIVHSYTEPVL